MQANVKQGAYEGSEIMMPMGDDSALSQQRAMAASASNFRQNKIPM